MPDYEMTDVHNAQRVDVWLLSACIASASVSIAGLSVWITMLASGSQSGSNGFATVLSIGLGIISAGLITVPASLLPAKDFMRWFLLASLGSLWVPPVVTVSGLNLRPSHLLIPSGLVIIWRKNPPEQLSLPRIRHGLLAVLLWLAYLLWTVVNPQDRDMQLGHVTLLGLNLLHYAIAYVLMRDSREQEWEIVRWLAVCTIVMTGWSIISYVGSVWGYLQSTYAETIAIVAGEELVIASVERLGTGVLTGTFSAYMFVVMLVAATCGGENRYRLILLSGAISALIGLVLGISRGAIVGFLVGMLMVVLFSTRDRKLRKGLLVGIVLAFGVGFALLGLGTVLPKVDLLVRAFLGRWRLLLDPEAYLTGTAWARLSAWSMMWEDIAKNPFWGYGADAFRRYFPLESLASENFFLEILHSAGLLGFLPVVVMVGSGIWSAVWRVIYDGRISPDHRQVIVGFCAGFTGLLVGSLTNPAGWAALFWVTLGLLAGATDARR